VTWSLGGCPTAPVVVALYTGKSRRLVPGREERRPQTAGRWAAPALCLCFHRWDGAKDQ
jgi:hypothetical protein